MSPLLSLSRVSFWLQLPSLCPLISLSLLLSLLSRHWPLSLFLLIPQLSPLSYHPLPSDLSRFFLHLCGAVPSALSLLPSPICLPSPVLMSYFCFILSLCSVNENHKSLWFNTDATWEDRHREWEVSDGQKTKKKFACLPDFIFLKEWSMK